MKKRVVSIFIAAVMLVSLVSAMPAAANTAKTELQQLVNSFTEEFLETELYTYGTVSFIRFEYAFEYAEYVLADNKSESRDFTTAKFLLETARDNLLKKTLEDLEALLASTKAVYDANNVFNARGDLIYQSHQFNSFKLGYEMVELLIFIEEDDTNIITDFWEYLTEAFENLEKMPVVTKAEADALMTEIDKTLLLRTKFSDSQRGEADTPWGERVTSYRIDYTSNTFPLTWGVLWEGNNYLRTGEYWAYFYPYDYGVYKFENEYHKIFNLGGVTSTTDYDLVETYYALTRTIAMINNFVDEYTDIIIEETLKTKAELNDLIQSAFDITNVSPFFIDLFSNLIFARLDAIFVHNKAFTAEEIADKDDQREYGKAYDDLNNTINAYNQILERFPVSMNDVIDLLNSSSNTADKNVIEKRTALAIAILDNVWESDLGTSQTFMGRFFKVNGDIDKGIYLRAFDRWGYPHPFPAYTAYIELLEAVENKCAVSHDWNDWVIITPATRTAEGKRERTCKNCSEKEPGTIPKITGGGGGGGNNTPTPPAETPPVTPPPAAPEKPHEYTTGDALIILRYVAGLIELTEEQKKLFDMNGDGEVNTADALAILRKVAGL
ncbi:MAG: dockerin type I repeat-containing protein [Oscillospiraceae bacterium]|nr:dockerin type I repeat-containing protein [Oscillospiraceae bacterium]